MISIKEEKILFPLKGYSKKLNKEQSYQVAKTPAVKWKGHEGVSNDEYHDLIDKHQWLGMPMHNTTVVDIDRIVNDDTAEIIQDGHQVGKLLLSLLKAEGYSFHAIRTPNGYQFIFKHTEGPENNVKQVTPLGVIADYRVKDKGYIVYPTDNTDGREWKYRSDKELSNVPPFLYAMKKYHENMKFLPIFPIHDGARNDTFNRWLFEVKNFYEGKERSQYVNAVGHLLATYMCDVPYTSREEKRELEATIDSVLSKPNREIRPLYEFTIDDGERLTGNQLKKALQQCRFKELEDLQKAWEDQGKNGRKPNTISTIRCAVLLIRYVEFTLFDLEENTKLAMYLSDEGIYTQNTTLIQRVISWLEPKHNKTKADEVMYHIRNMVGVKEKTNNRYLVPVNNGVFNLKTKKLEDFSPDYVFTSKVSTNYVENPELPEIDGWNIEQWLEDISLNDPEITELLWQVINDSLNGNYTRKKAIFLVGDGNNGKGTFQELLTNVIGFKNVATLKVNEFDERFRLSVLEGKTAVIGDDVPVGVYLDDSSNFKSVVTGDTVSVEFKGQPIYNTSFKCTVIQSTNGMPRFKDRTSGNTRRLLIVPFNANFDGGRENLAIKEDYIKRPEVLEYVLNKAIHKDFEKFIEPKQSLNALDEFKQDNDPVYEFKINVFDKWKIPKVPKYIVYDFYKNFCNENGYKTLSVRKFHNDFKKHLENYWDTDCRNRFEWSYLEKFVGDLDTDDTLNYISEFPDKNKVYAAYQNNLLEVV